MDGRPVIRQLPQALINRIAAGEVVERPASVVKELIENAIDAGATQITIDIEEGGRKLIRIVDDGRGIAPDQLPLAFAPHATSKLTDDADLLSIRTMGFRGEALASIGSVSRCRIVTRTNDGDAAFGMDNTGGEVTGPTPAAGNVGTTVEVRDLFFNVPARRKFLKATGTESSYVTETVLKLALANPSVGFRYSRDGKVAHDLPPGVDRLLAGWPKEFRDQHLAVDRRDQDYHLHGIVGLPELAAPHMRYQYLFVAGRPVKDRHMIHALREAFRGLCEPGRHPAAVLMLNLPPGAVDVNVHPQKLEVRFRESNRVHALVMSSVKQALLGANLAPKLKPKVEEPEPPRENVRETLAAFFKQDLQQQTRLENVQPVETTEVAAPPAVPPSQGDGSSNGESREEVDPALPIRGAIQLHNSYLVTQTDDGMVIIDQHALHERIIFEDLLQRIRRGNLESQHLLMPLTFDADGRQLEVLETLRPMLLRLGIDAEAFGPDAVAVRSFPSFLHKLDPVDFLQQLLQRDESELEKADDETVLHEVLDMMSCKAAVKAGDPLTPEEITALLARRDLVSRSSNCPHGRPTTLRLSLTDLERQFKRTGF
ncbi:MAG: DNA mismatch repair endonuclease MutL [Planctomycetota bacterium]